MWLHGAYERDHFNDVDFSVPRDLLSTTIMSTPSYRSPVLIPPDSRNLSHSSMFTGNDEYELSQGAGFQPPMQRLGPPWDTQDDHNDGYTSSALSTPPPLPTNASRNGFHPWPSNPPLDIECRAKCTLELKLDPIIQHPQDGLEPNAIHLVKIQLCSLFRRFIHKTDISRSLKQKLWY